MLTISTANINNIQFKADPKKNNKNGTDASDAVHKSSNTKTKLFIGATAVAAIVLAGLAISKGRRGKLTPIVDTVKESSQQSSKERLAEELEEERIKEEVQRYFKREEREAEELKQKIAESDARNEEWLQAQHTQKEKEYSDWWSKALKEKEEYEARNQVITFERPLIEKSLGNDVDLEYFLPKFQTSDATKTALEECKDLTYDSPNLVLMRDKYDGSTTYDLGLRYAIVANNTARAKGTAAIINEVPEMFEGVDQKELIRVLDELPARLAYDKFNHFEISGKKYTAKGLSGGNLNTVYTITDEAGNKICYKYAIQPYIMTSGHGIYNEVAILHEANKAGVCDVPKLYMANPIGCYVMDADGKWQTSKGAWQLVEYIDGAKPVNPKSLKFTDWLESKGLYHGDIIKADNRIGNVVIDMGGINDYADTINDVFSKSSGGISWLFRAYYNGYSTQDIINAIEKYSKK